MGLDEWIIPGLVKVIEERFGPFGRPMATALIFLIWLGVVVFVADLVRTKAIQPIASAAIDGVLGKYGETILIFATGFVTWAVLYIRLRLVVARLDFVRIRRPREELMREQEQNRLQYESYLSDLNAIARELGQHGIRLKTVTIDAEQER